jgi:hypothetical protein
VGAASATVGSEARGMRLRRKPRAFWAHPDTHEISKFFPRNPPVRGDTVLVDGARCKVLACPVSWEGRTWTMKRGVKVRPLP